MSEQQSVREQVVCACGFYQFYHMHLCSMTSNKSTESITSSSRAPLTEIFHFGSHITPSANRDCVSVYRLNIQLIHMIIIILMIYFLIHIDGHINGFLSSLFSLLFIFLSPNIVYIVIW